MLQQALVTIISIFIVTIPLVVINYQFEVPKVFTFLILGIFLIFYLILNIQKLKFKKRDYYYLIWLLTLLVSGFLGSDPKTSILGGSYRHQGLVFFVVLYFLMKFKETVSVGNLNTLYKFIGLGVITQAFIVLFGFKLGTVGEINAVAGFISIGTYFVYISFPKIFLSIPVISMLILFSKSAFLSLIPYLYKKVNIFILLTSVVILFVIKPVNILSSFESRNVIWNYAVDIISDKPILGHGAESNEVLFNQKFLENKIILTNLRIDRAHNLFLDITIWSGLIGLYLFVMFLFESFKNLNFEKKQVFLSFLIYSMFQPLSVVHWILFALIV